MPKKVLTRLSSDVTRGLPDDDRRPGMKLALLSDIHANIQAFEACLAHARGQGAQKIALLGDFVGYGADPVAVVQRSQQLAADGAWLIKGNHDAGAVAPPAVAKTWGDSTTAWTHARLKPEHLQFLDELPMTLQHSTLLLVHASADGPDLWRYVYDKESAAASLSAAIELPEVRHVFGGHVHHQTLYVSGLGSQVRQLLAKPGVGVAVPANRHWLATIGSVGQPRDGNPQAMYAMFDTDQLLFTFHRVSYDHLAAAAAIRKAGLPDWLASRLALGR
jgi:diadenosine tetraphosphatase ApaH/serine/threonine PP2A family protein phosphatase